eukprot:5602361-Prymnesium_polylepis.1
MHGRLSTPVLQHGVSSVSPGTAREPLMSDERVRAQRAALAAAEAELERAAKQGRAAKNGRRGPVKGGRAEPDGSAELVGRAVANHLGQGFHGM